TGKTEPGAVVDLFSPSAGYLPGQTADENGNFSFDIPEQLGGTELEVTAYSNNKTVVKTVKVIDTGVNIAAPQVNEVNEKDGIISGKTEPNATVIVKIEDWGSVQKVKADENGNFNFKCKYQLEAGLTLSVQAQNGNHLSPKTKVTVKESKVLLEI
ncbi:hypothetical protein COK29_33615, partial [Bacillus cereus]|uniref:Ig-like domain-containing protein n=1 Tax=Bacillus cereus TaxID=1396 RepID=UPI000C01C25E